MSHKPPPARPASLAQHFEAPDDYLGHCGWLCGYSADAPFLDDALERFTRLSQAQRAHQGRIALAVMLNASNPQISCLAAPGVAHLPLLPAAPFRLLHAKVALLGFRHQDDPGRWQLRLLVATGNWTRQTLEESLDLIWRIDIGSQELEMASSSVQQDCCDLQAAWSLLQWLQQRCDDRLLQAAMAAQVQQWIAACAGQAKGRPRFFDSRRRPLLDQLAEQVQALSPVRRNYLAMGSGFYEAGNGAAPPQVPLEIVDRLRAAGLLTLASEVDIYVNPQACQAIASAQPALKQAGMVVRPAAIPESVFGAAAARSLHAKFLFSANRRAGSNLCGSAWVYLGSGNLTRPGFQQPMHPQTGNLEAGVVLAPGAVYWEPERGVEPAQVLTHLLPVQWELDFASSDALCGGAASEPREALFLAAPIAWLSWCPERAELQTAEPGWPAWQVLDLLGQPCAQTDSGFVWPDPAPREVSLCWTVDGRTQLAQIPVIDEYGRIAATALPSIDIQEASWQLANFPLPAPVDEPVEPLEEGLAPAGRPQPAAQARQFGSYPLREMMQLIEGIAASQCQLESQDWPRWCQRLEQTLGQAADSPAVVFFRQELALNPLSPLREPAFRPEFALDGASAEGQRYEAALDAIELRWQVDGCKPLGALA